MGGPWGDLMKSLEYPIWAAILGLIANGILTVTNLKERIRPAIRTGEGARR